MSTLEILFTASLLILFFSYGGYAMPLWLISKLKGRKNNQSEDGHYKSVTLVVAAYNEAGFMEEKIRNCLELDYPSDMLTIIIVTDGSDDGTDSIVRKFPQITLMHENTRAGKVAAINRVMGHVSSDIVIFSDANTLLNKEAIRRIAAHYQDPKVGGVAGEKRVKSTSSKDLSGEGEGFYWKYESFLKRMDSEFHTVVGAAGELFSIRTTLYEEPEKNVLLDDFMISMKVCLKGYVVKYEPGAYAEENASASIAEERKRKIRISAGAFQTMAALGKLFAFWKHPKLTYLYVSHRVLRWTICPILLPLMFILSVLMAFQEASITHLFLLIGQATAYVLAILGYYFAERDISFKPAYIAYYFTFMNLSLYQGFVRYLKGKQSVIWDKAKRAETE